MKSIIVSLAVMSAGMAFGKAPIVSPCSPGHICVEPQIVSPCSPGHICLNR